MFIGRKTRRSLLSSVTYLLSHNRELEEKLLALTKKIGVHLIHKDKYEYMDDRDTK